MSRAPVSALTIRASIWLLALAVKACLDFGLTAWRVTQDADTQATAQEAVADALQNVLGGMVPRFATQNPQDMTLAFHGTPTAIRFVAPLPDAVLAGVTVSQILGLAWADGRAALVLDWQDGAAQVVVQDDVTALDLRYWRGDGGGWVDNWAGQTVLPGAIAIHVGLRHGMPIDLVVAPRAQVPPQCRYDRVGPSCRHLP